MLATLTCGEGKEGFACQSLGTLRCHVGLNSHWQHKLVWDDYYYYILLIYIIYMIIMRCSMQMVPDLSSHNYIFVCLGFNSAHGVYVQGITKKHFFNVTVEFIIRDCI